MTTPAKAANSVPVISTPGGRNIADLLAMEGDGGAIDLEIPAPTDLPRPADLD